MRTLKITKFVHLLLLAVTWSAVHSQLPLSPEDDDSGQVSKGRSSGRASGDLLMFQRRGSVAAAAVSGRAVGLSPFSTSSLCVSSLDCSDEKRKPICGTDGRTYYSRCEINKAKCEGHLVEFKHKAKCPESGRCVAQRAHAQDQSLRFPTMGISIPQCREDGSFHEVQCHESTGYCWCVDESGKAIQRSTVRYRKPNCAQQGSRRLNRRRTSSKGPRQNKACSNTDRSTFNHNLIEIFRSEFRRSFPGVQPVPSPGTDPMLDTDQKRVVQWKFTQLDKNSDNILKRKEVGDLRRMAKKIVRPRPCAKSFTKYCDLDHDKKITRSEWSACLGVDINSSAHLVVGEPPASSDHDDDDASIHHDPDEDDDEELDADDGHARVDGDLRNIPVADSQVSSLGLSSDQSSRRNPHHLDSGDRGLSRPLSGDERFNDGVMESKEEDISDCFSARRSATEQHLNAPKAGHFIPNCTPDGGYQSAQCHAQRGYCWCVQEKSGKTIKGTATKDGKPDCEAAKKSARAFKGCSLKKKQRFTEEYLEFLAQEMAEFYKNRSQSVMTEQVTKEQVAKWKMSELDTNKNQFLDRKEWKAFRKDWKIFRKGNPRRTKLRKCWRNYLRYCDANADHRITMSEWLSCTSSIMVPAPPAALPATSLGQDAVPVKGNTVSESTHPKPRGPNPFDKILKSD